MRFNFHFILFFVFFFPTKVIITNNGRTNEYRWIEKRKEFHFQKRKKLYKICHSHIFIFLIVIKFLFNCVGTIFSIFFQFHFHFRSKGEHTQQRQKKKKNYFTCNKLKFLMSHEPCPLLFVLCSCCYLPCKAAYSTKKKIKIIFRKKIVKS